MIYPRMISFLMFKQKRPEQVKNEKLSADIKLC